MKVEEKVALCAIKHHPDSHITLDHQKCSTCKTRVCVAACPAGLYSLEASGDRVRVDHTGCLECGTCLLICPLGAVKWAYPEPGHGVCYRFG
jgi:ferredoxin like protein